MRTFKVYILGSSSATPTSVRNPSSQLINVDEKVFLIDCGEGTQMQLRRMRFKMSRINNVFISHLHGDHYFGLVGLISTMHLFGRINTLRVYGPEPLEDIILSQLKASQTQLCYPLEFYPTTTSGPALLLDEKSFTVSSFPLEHRIETTGFLVQEKHLGLKLRKKALEKACVPLKSLAAIKAGDDYITPEGVCIPNSELTYPPVPARSYAYCSDTRISDSYLEYIKGVDLLYHEATFLHELKDVAREKFHSTSYEAAQVAVKAGASELVLGHFSARYKDVTPILDEAQLVFPNTKLATDGMCIEVTK